MVLRGSSGVQIGKSYSKLMVVTLLTIIALMWLPQSNTSDGFKGRTPIGVGLAE